MFRIKILAAVMVIIASAQSIAQLDSFHAGKVITDYGKIAKVDGMDSLPENASFKVSFDVAKQAQLGEVNRSLDSVARFINMHAEAGVSVDRINLAVVIHGGAVKDMTIEKSYQSLAKNPTQLTQPLNANAALISALQQQGVVFYVCGQSAVYHGVKTSDLLPGVKMSLSAMTAHALLQQQGYSLNPF